MAGVPVGVVLQVVLVLRLGLPEVPGRADLGHHFAWPKAGRLDVGDGVQRDSLLLVIEVEDRRAVTGSPVVTLLVLCRRIVDLEEELQHRAVIGNRRVVNDFNGLGMGAVVTVGRVGDVAAGVTDPGCDHTRLFADQVLHSPEATASQDGFFSGCHA